MRGLRIGCLALAALATLARPPAAGGGGGIGGPTLEVFVSIPPQAYLVDRIGGNRVDCHVLVPPGQTPHAFEPTPGQMVSLAESAVYFSIGLPFEARLLERIEGLHNDLSVVDTSRGVERRPLTDAEPTPSRTAQDERHHAHGFHGSDDPHIWLDPSVAGSLADTIADALARVDPDGAPVYDANLDSLKNDLTALDRELRRILEPFRGRAIYVFHPAFGYFADAYGLRQIAVQTGGAEPGARDLARLVSRAQEEDVRAIFVQPQYSARTARALADEIGAAVVPLDPLAYEYPANLRSMAAAIVDVLRDPSKGDAGGESPGDGERRER